MTKKNYSAKVYAVQTFERVNGVHMLLYQVIRENKQLAELEKACQQRVFNDKDYYTKIELYEIKVNKLVLE